MADNATAVTLEMNFMVNINLTFDSRGLKNRQKSFTNLLHSTKTGECSKVNF